MEKPVGPNPWGGQELDTTESLTHTHTVTISSTSIMYLKFSNRIYFLVTVLITIYKRYI